MKDDMNDDMNDNMEYDMKNDMKDDSITITLSREEVRNLQRGVITTTTNNKSYKGDLWDIDAYTKKFGSLDTNGLGHQVRTISGKTGVFVPAPRIIRIEENVTETMEDDTTTTITTTSRHFP